MSENADDIIGKMQCVLDNYFCYLGNFAFDKAKEYLDKERDAAVKHHAVAPFFSSALSAFSLLATAEKNYNNFIFLGPKGFLRKDCAVAVRSAGKHFHLHVATAYSSLKSMYESLSNEYQRLEERHYITPVSTPTMSPTASSCRTPSPPSTLQPPSPISASSEVSGSVPSSISVGSSTRSSIQSYQGEDILENLASHLCGQLLCFVKARLKTMEFYEKMFAMSSARFMRFDVLLNIITEIVQTNMKLFHHPMLTHLKSSFRVLILIPSKRSRNSLTNFEQSLFECEILMKLIEAEINMQNWRFLPSLMSLQDAYAKLGAWISMPKEIKKLSSSSTFRMPPTPPLYNWLLTLKGALLSKFSVYFHETLSKQTNPMDMKSYCAKTTFDYIPRIIAFQKRYDVACIAIVLDTNGLDDYRGHGYFSPDKRYEAPKGLDSFPPIYTYPPNCITLEKHMSHWPSVVMIMNNKEQEIRNTDSYLFYDTRMNATYFMSKIEQRMTLVFIFESKKTDKDTHIHRFMQSLSSQLRGNKIFASLKPGSK